jgi:DNA-binding beta-propeller fold protein YncE
VKHALPLHQLFGFLLLAGGLFSRAYAADNRSTEPEAAPLSFVQTISLPQIAGRMNHLAADVKRGRFFVTAPEEKKVIVVDLNAGKVLRTLPGPATAALFVPDLDQLCVAGGGAVAFFDGESLAAKGQVRLESALDELQYNFKHKRLYVGMMDSDKAGIAVIDLANHKLIAKIRLPAKPQGFAVEQEGTRLFANTPGARQVTVLDRNTGTVAAQWKLTEAQSNYPMALDEKNQRLFVGCRRPARLLVLDSATGRTITSTECGGDADDMSFDATAKRIYVACGDGVISAIQQVDADHYRKLPDTPTARGARNSLFVPERKTFYLAVPRQATSSTQLRAYQASD